jgi:hypothetical protein
MSCYRKIVSTFWTGETGRSLRAAGPEAQLVALYLLTCQASHMSGLYYVAMPTISHETGLSMDAVAQALRCLSEVGFAHFDSDSEVVWVPEMAHHQIGATLHPKDNRHIALVQHLDDFRKSKFRKAFLKRYRVDYQLQNGRTSEGPSKDLRRTSEGPSKPLRSQTQTQTQTQEQIQEQKKEQKREQNPEPAEPANAGVFPSQKSFSSQSQKELQDAIADVTGSDPKVSRSRIAEVAQAFAQAEPPYTADDVRRWASTPHIVGWLRGRRPTLTYLRDNIGQIRAGPSDVSQPPPDGETLCERVDRIWRDRHRGSADTNHVAQCRDGSDAAGRQGDAG